MNNLTELIDFRAVQVGRNNAFLLENINFRLYNAELVFIVGDSGNGKSTFLKSLYGAADIAGEHAMLLGYNLLDIKRQELQNLRRKLGLVFQDYKIFDKLSVYENLNYFLQSINVKDQKKRQLNVESILDKVGLGLLHKNKGFELSGGEKQRLAIARALIHKPQLIIADEPTGNLNQKLGIEIFSLLRELALIQGTSIITATHDLSLAEIFSAKVYQCGDGMITQR